jgi:putative hydrolase of the HAD superfamily
MSEQRLAIFDLDDTLVDTSHVYWVSRSAFLDVMVREGFDKELALAEFETTDSRHILEDGYVPERYERSMKATYEELCRRAERSPNVLATEQIEAAGKIIVNSVPELIPGAVELLDSARALGYLVVLITRGIETVQRAKLAFHDLSKHFEIVKIVSMKSSETFNALINESKVKPSNAWVIGDSVRSDINPAIKAGANGILYLYTHPSYYWQQEYGVEPIGSFRIANSLPQVLHILSSPSEVPVVSQLPSRNPLLPI